MHLLTGQGQSPATVLVQKGEKVEEALMVELGDMHGEQCRTQSGGLRRR